MLHVLVEKRVKIVQLEKCHVHLAGLNDAAVALRAKHVTMLSLKMAIASDSRQLMNLTKRTFFFCFKGLVLRFTHSSAGITRSTSEKDEMSFLRTFDRCSQSAQFYYGKKHRKNIMVSLPTEARKTRHKTEKLACNVNPW